MSDVKIPTVSNLFQLPADARPGAPEYITTLLSRKGLQLKKLVSHGQTTPDNEWYEQDDDEWVVLLSGQARLAFENGSELALQAGDYLLIPARLKHRVSFTSVKPPCIWLALHTDIQVTS